ncbi:MAG: trehalose-phosphatase [Candidatus Dormibacteria bacterium]
MGLDFDGTLSPIVARPEDARLDPALEPILTRLRAAVGWVVVISGRERAFLEDRVDGMMTIGSYGLELPAELSSSGIREGFRAGEVRARLEDARQDLEGRLPPASRLEVKAWGLALHYRGAGPGFDEPAAVRLAEDVAERHRLTVQRGRLVVELKPQEAVDKGWALALLAAKLQPSAVVFIGDDLGDVPAWEAARQLGERISSLAVALASPELPRGALASCDLVLSDRSVLGDFLEALTDAAAG